MPTASLQAPSDPRVLGLFQALAEDNRLRIVQTLRHGERCVCELQEELGIAQSLLSHHLRTLREAGLVNARRDGRWMHYSLDSVALQEAADFLGGAGEDAASAPTHTPSCP